MKKRLLALCLAAAMLLGMLPVMTLVTNAVETNVTTTKINDFVTTRRNETQEPVYKGYGSPDVAGTKTSVFANENYLTFRKNCNDVYHITTAGHSGVSFDRSKEILLTQTYNIYTGDDQGVTAKLSVDSNGVVAGANSFTVTLKDKETGTFLYYFLSGGAGGSGTDYQLGFLLPDGTTNQYVPLGISGAANTGTFQIGIQWNIDGSATVLVGGEEKGTVEGATWTVDETKDAGTAWNPAANLSASETTTEYDFIAYKSWGWNYTLIYDMSGADTVITHTEYLPAQLEGVFTSEALTAEGALNESSWAKASFEDLGNGLQAAVLVNKGVAYVALKGTDGTYNVQLGTITKEVTVSGGVGEVEIGNVGLAAYGETREMTVGTAKASVTFAAKKVNSVDTVTTKVDTHTNVINAYCNTSNSAYVSFAKQAIQYIEKSGSHGDVIIDRSGDVTIDLQMTFQENAFAAGMTTLTAGTNNAYTPDVKNYLLFAPYDSATKTHFLAYFTADAEYDLYLRFYLKDKTTADVDLGKNIKDTDGSITQIDLKTLQLVWNTDGSVTVKLNGGELQTVQNATWDTNTSHLGYLDSPGSSDMNVNYDYYHIRGQRESGNNAYLWGLYFTNAAPATVDITTSVADDLAAKVETALGDLSDVSFLPQAVEHDYLGAVALTWSDTEGLVSNNVLTIPAEDTATTLTAKAGETTVWSGDVTVQAADPIVGVFTPEDLTSGAESWTLVPFTNLNNSTDSVAVLATDTNNVYVAVKSADSSATVILNGSEQTVAIADGMGVVKYENVGLSAYGDARTIKVTTSTGSLDTKVLFNATEVKLPYTKIITADLTKNVSAVNTFGESGSLITLRSHATNLGIYSKDNTYGDLNIDRTKDVTINLGVSIQQGFLGATAPVTMDASTGSWVASAKEYVLFSFVDNDAEVDSFFYGWFTNDASGNVVLGFLGNNKETNTLVTLEKQYAQWGSNTADIRVDLLGLNLVWKTNGDIDVVLDGVVLQTVKDATWTGTGLSTASGHYVENANVASTNNADYVRMHSYTPHSANFYIYNISLTTDEPGSVQDIVKAKVENYNVTLKSDVAMNFLMNDVAGAALKVVHNGETYTYYTDELSANDAGYLTARLDLAAAQMADDISVTVIDAYGMTTEPVTTSVEDYAAAALAAATDDNVKNMINAMLNYGAAAKAYFNYQIDNAMGAVTAPALGTLTDLDAAAYNHSVEGAIEGITATSATLRLEEQVKIRFYFSGDITAYEVTGGEAVYDEATGRSYVDVAVAPKSIDEMKTVTVSDGTNTLSVTYGCMTYLTRHADDADLGDLMQAIYTYSLAAEAYPA